MRSASRRGHVPKPELISTAAFGAILGVLQDHLEELPHLYAETLDEGHWPPGGSGLHTTGGDPSDATVAGWEGKYQRRRRKDAQKAVEWIRKAAEAVWKAEAVLLGDRVIQPEERDPRATMNQAEFDQWRREHRRRERELRG